MAKAYSAGTVVKVKDGTLIDGYRCKGMKGHVESREETKDGVYYLVRLNIDYPGFGYMGPQKRRIHEKNLKRSF